MFLVIFLHFWSEILCIPANNVNTHDSVYDSCTVMLHCYTVRLFVIKLTFIYLHEAWISDRSSFIHLFITVRVLFQEVVGDFCKIG